MIFYDNNSYYPVLEWILPMNKSSPSFYASVSKHIIKYVRYKRFRTKKSGSVRLLHVQPSPSQMIYSPLSTAEYSRDSSGVNFWILIPLFLTVFFSFFWSFRKACLLWSVISTEISTYYHNNIILKNKWVHYKRLPG